MPPRLSFESSVDDRHAFDCYREVFADVFETSSDPSGFRCRSSKVHLGAAILSRGAATAQVFRRPRALTRRNGIDAIQILCDLDGEWTGDYDGRSAQGRVGSVRFVDLARPFANGCSAFDTLGLIVPRSALGKEWASRDVHGLVLREDTGGARLLTAHLRTMWSNADSLSPIESAAAVDAAGLLARGALSAGVVLGAEHVEPVARTLFSIARDFIDAHLASAALAPASIGRHLGVSQRTLYRIFRDVGGVSAYVQARRLDKAYDTIAAAPAGRLSVAEIAYASGFASDAHFSRAFRERFGMRPGDVRRERTSTAAPAGSPATYGSTFVDWCKAL